MHSPSLSIIIPTYNRKDIVKKTLDAYGRQTALREMLEILVVDDGSTDGTAELLTRNFSNSHPPIRILRKANGGLASARNLGLSEAHGEIVLFGDDDIFPAKNMVAEHLAWHRRYPDDSVGILGYVTWDPSVHPTPLMKWLGNSGPLFNFKVLAKGQPTALTHVYFCNTSVKPAFLRSHGLFDEDFRSYGFEDTELAFRLQRRGLRVLYNPKAVGYHHKRMSFADVCRRADAVEAARKLLETKEAGAYLGQTNPDFQPPRPLRVFLRHCLAPAFAPLRPLLDSQIPLPHLVYRVLYNQYVESRRKSSGPRLVSN